MKNTLIIAGGDIDIDYAKKYYEQNDFTFVIAVDGGLKIAEMLDIIPNYIVGDFDTISPLILFKYENMNDVKIKRFKPDKDFTDTQIAINIAIEEESFSISILGGTGSRLDHTLANVQLLQMALANGVEAIIVSRNNRVRLLGTKRKDITIFKDEYKYVSLIPMSDVVSGITTKGMKWNLSNFDFRIDEDISRGVSNEIVGQQAEIHIDGGTLILIESND